MVCQGILISFIMTLCITGYESFIQNSKILKPPKSGSFRVLTHHATNLNFQISNTWAPVLSAVVAATPSCMTECFVLCGVKILFEMLQWLADIPMGNSEMKKRKHLWLSTSKKVKPLEKLDSSVSVQHLTEEFGHGTSTIYGLQKQKEKLLKFESNEKLLKYRKHCIEWNMKILTGLGNLLKQWTLCLPNFLHSTVVSSMRQGVSHWPKKPKFTFIDNGSINVMITSHALIAGVTTPLQWHPMILQRN